MNSAKQTTEKTSIFLCYYKEGKYQLAVATPDENAHNPPPSPTPNSITFDFAKTIVFTLWITVTVNRCHVHSTSDVSNCSIPRENSPGKKLIQFKADFPGIFAVSFVAFLCMNFQMYFAYVSVCTTDTELIQKRNRQPD